MPHWPWGFSGRQAFGTLHNEGTLPQGRGKVGLDCDVPPGYSTSNRD